MIDPKRRILLAENIVLTILWALAIFSPLLFLDRINNDWRSVYVMWVESAVVGFAFLVNRLLLTRRLFFKQKYLKYFIAVLILLIFMAVIILHFDIVNVILSKLGVFPRISPQAQLHALGEMGIPEEILPQRPLVPSPMIRPHGSALPPAVSVLALSAIVMALDTCLSIAIRWFINEQEKSERDKEQVATQLSNLQRQVSPHFLMNTLNNIHALVDIDSQRAKQTIIELSALMDYLVYDSSDSDSVPLHRELRFIDSYISLMRLRYPKQVTIDFVVDEPTPKINIPPLLFLNFIENAFKYGVDYTKPSFIEIHFSFEDNHITMKAQNSNHAAAVNNNSNRHGLGINNSRKRLGLLYGEDYTLSISERSDIYSVIVKIPIV